MSLDTQIYLTISEAAEVIGVSERTLHRWHALRTGPPRLKIGGEIGGPIRYRLAALHDWFAANEEPARMEVKAKRLIEERARRYISKGWQVFPVDRSTGERREGSLKWENAHICLPTGQSSKIFVIEVESYAALNDFQCNMFYLVDMLHTIRVPGGGFQFFLAMPEKGEILSEVIWGYPGVTVRGDEDHVRLPDPHNSYFWACAWACGDGGVPPASWVAAAPADLVDHLQGVGR